MTQLFDFEKPLLELENKIRELQSFSKEKGIDISGEIEKLEQKASELRNDIYTNLEPWQRVQIARHPERPNFYDYLRFLFEDFIELKGDRLYGDDPAIAGGIGIFRGIPVTVIAQLKGKDTKENIKRNFGMPHPEGYRKALRLMEQADKFNRPVLTFIDTPGAACDLNAEQRGQGEAIARCIQTMAGLRVPVISTIIGEGGSGGALALGVGNVILMLENAFYSVIAPESCASILWKDAQKARDAAEALRFTAKDLREFGIADQIVKEPLGGAHKNPQIAAEALSQAIAGYLVRLRGKSAQDLRDSRYAKVRMIGIFSEQQ